MIHQDTEAFVQSSVEELARRAKGYLAGFQSSMERDIGESFGDDMVGAQFRELVFGASAAGADLPLSPEETLKNDEAKQLRSYFRWLLEEDAHHDDAAITMKLVQGIFMEGLIAPIVSQLLRKLRHRVEFELEDRLKSVFSTDIGPILQLALNKEARGYSEAIASRMEYLYDVTRQNIRCAMSTGMLRISTDEVQTHIEVSEFLPSNQDANTTTMHSDRGRVVRSSSINVEPDEPPESLTRDERDRLGTALPCHMSVEGEEALKPREGADERLRRLASNLRNTQKVSLGSSLGQQATPFEQTEIVLSSSTTSSPLSTSLQAPAQTLQKPSIASSRKGSAASFGKFVVLGRSAARHRQPVPSEAEIFDDLTTKSVPPRLASRPDALVWMSADECHSRIQREEALWQQNDQLRTLLRARYKDEEDRILERERQARCGMYMEESEHHAKYNKLFDQTLELAGTIQISGDLAEMLLRQLEHARHYSRKLEAELMRLRTIGAEAAMCRSQVRLERLLREFEETHVEPAEGVVTTEMHDISIAEEAVRKMAGGYKAAADILCDVDLVAPDITMERLVAVLQHNLPPPTVLEVQGNILEAACSVVEIERENRRLLIELTDAKKALLFTQRKVISDVTAVKAEKRMQFEALHKKYVLASKQVAELQSLVRNLTTQLREERGGDSVGMSATSINTTEERLQLVISDLHQQLNAKEQELQFALQDDGEMRRRGSTTPWWQGLAASRPSSARPASASRWSATPVPPPTEPEEVSLRQVSSARTIPVRPLSAKAFPRSNSVGTSHAKGSDTAEIQPSPTTCPIATCVAPPSGPKQYGNWRAAASYRLRANPSIRPTSATVSHRVASFSAGPSDNAARPRPRKGFTNDPRYSSVKPSFSKEPEVGSDNH